MVISSVKLSQESLVHLNWIKQAHCSQLTKLLIINKFYDMIKIQGSLLTVNGRLPYQNMYK